MAVRRDDRLAGKVALVSGGGSSGQSMSNGHAEAILLARSGAQVLVADANEESAEHTAAMIEDEGGSARAVRCDVTVEEDCRVAAQTALDAFGGVDILVNNVGIDGPLGSVENIDLLEWDRTFRVNVTSILLMTRYVAASIRGRGGGSIVNIASIDGLAGGSGLAYPTTKGAVVNMTRALAFICGPARIRVNALAPGRIWSARLSDRPNVDEVNRDRRRKASALETEGTPFDVGMATVFLASDEARWITGVILPVDGGETAILRRPEVFSEEMLRSVGLRMESEVDPEGVASS